MANEKILNTRIQLKYDSFANWENSTVILKAGEVAIAYLGKTVSDKLKGTNRPVLFKVGDGVSTFVNLPWASALAADVYDWAKKSETEFVEWVNGVIVHPDFPTLSVKDEETGKFVVDIEVNDHEIIIHRANIVAADIAEAQSKDYGKVTADEGEIEADAIHDTFAIVGEGVVSTKAAGDTVTISVDLGEYTKTEDLVDNNTVTVIEEGTGIEVEETVAGNVHTYTVSHQEKPTTGTAETATAGTGRTYVTEVLVDELGHIAGVKTATETVVDTDTNTAHTHTAGDGLKLTGNGGIDGAVDYSLNLALKLENGSIVLHDKDDATKVIATLEADELLEDSYLNDVEIVDNVLQFTWKMDDGSTKTDSVDLTHLVDVYTGESEGTVKVEVNDYKISAEVIEGTLENKHIAEDAAIAETKLAQGVQDALALARTALQEHQSLENYKTKQTAYSAEGSTVKTVTKVEQTANGEVSVTYGDIAFPAPPVVNDGKFTVSGVGSLTGSGEMTANQAGDTVANLDIANGGVTTAKIADKAVTTAKIDDKAVTTDKIADHAVGAHQTKACKDYEDNADAEVWVFYCGSATELV